jgi:hypothetical protein
MKRISGLMMAILLFFPSGSIYGVRLPIASRFENENIFKPVKIIISNSLVYLLDKTDQSVKVFTRDKKLVRTIGRKGAGPGELMNPSDFQVLNGNVYLLDFDKIKVFSQKDGQYVTSRKITTFNTMKFCAYQDKFYISFAAFQKGGKLIKTYIAGENKGELQLVHSFLDCTPLKNNNFISIYKNFGSLACLKGKVYFAYMLSNKVLEFSENGKQLNQLTVPIRPFDVEKFKFESKGPGMNLTLDKGVNRTLRPVGEELYLLSQDEHGDSVIFRSEKDKFKEMYRLKEKIVSFDISGSEIWAIGHLEDIEILIYKIREEFNQKEKE